MRGWIIIGMLALGTSAFRASAADSAGMDGLKALDTYLDSRKGGKSESILGVVSFYGQPQPPQWLILTDVPEKPGVLRESVCSGGKVVAERKFKRLANQDLPDIPIRPAELKVSSAAAFQVAEREASKRKLSFDSAHFQLRCRDLRNEPVWMLNLISTGQVSVGVVYVSAVTGEVLRTTWIEPSTQKTFSSSPAEAPESNDGRRMALSAGIR